MTSPSSELSGLEAFDHSPRTRVIFGVGVVQRLGDLATELGGRRILLVTDPGIVKAGHAAAIEKVLRNASLEVVLYDQVHENPTTRDVAACLEVARAGKIDLIVGLGGGSSMDTAKGCNFLLTNGGEMRDYWGVGKASRPMLPLIAIPTTSGTGSECQSAALIADEQTHQKMACLDPKAAARIAILDPALTLSQPPRVTACTGLDAIAHAVETAVTRKRNSISSAYSNQAFRLCAGAFEMVMRDPTHLQARGEMLLGAALAGLAIENSMLGAAHAAANPLTAHFGIVHGQAVGMLLPAVVEFNSQEPAVASIYRQLSPGLIEDLKRWLSISGMPSRLRDAGVTEDSLSKLSAEAAKQWTAGFNPRKVAEPEFLTLYRSIY